MHPVATPHSLDSIVLLTGPTEAIALSGALRRHNRDLTIHRAHSLDTLEAIDLAVLRRSRLIGFATPVIVPPHILNALGFGAYNFHPGPPQYPGWVPAHFAIYDKADTFGATVHRMVGSVDAGPIVDVETFTIPPGTTTTRLQELAYIQLARLFWRLAPALAVQSEPLAEMPLAWSGIKSTKRMYKTICDLAPDISKDELERRVAAFGAGDFGVGLTVTLHGHTFRYVPPQAPAEPQVQSPAAPALVA